MSKTFEPGRWHALWFLLASVLLVCLCWFALRPTKNRVDAATQGLSVGRCAELPLLPVFGGCEGLVLLQLAGSQAPAQTIVNVIRSGGAAEAAVTSVKLDFLFILSYVAMFGFLGATVAGLERVRSMSWLRRLVLLVVLLVGVAGVLDGVENVGLFAMLTGDAVAREVPEWTFQAARAKWWLIGAGAVFPLLASAVAALAPRR